MNTLNEIAFLATMPQWYRNILDNSYEYLRLEKQLKSEGKVNIEDVKYFAETSVWSYWETLNFAVNNGRLPKI